MLPLVRMWRCIVGVVRVEGGLGRTTRFEVSPKLTSGGNGVPCNRVKTLWYEDLGCVVALGVDWVPATGEQWLLFFMCTEFHERTPKVIVRVITMIRRELKGVHTGFI